MKNAVFWDSRRVVLVRTDVSEECSAFILTVARISELGKMLALTRTHFRRVLLLLVTAKGLPNSQIFVTMMMEALLFSGTSILTKATRHKIPEDGILRSHPRDNLKSYIALTGCAL
jgi:hypothetical protein